MDLNPCCAPSSAPSALPQACMKQVTLKVQKYFRATIICVCCLFANAQRKDRGATRQARAGRAGALYSPETILLREKSDSEPSPQLEKDHEIHVVAGKWNDHWCQQDCLAHVACVHICWCLQPQAQLWWIPWVPKEFSLVPISLGISDISYSFDSTERS